jgi:hypothetical protein
MTGLRTLTIIAALLAGGASLASAQSGNPTGGYPSVAGGANGNPAVLPAPAESVAPCEQTVAEIATRYREFVDQFERASIEFGL